MSTTRVTKRLQHPPALVYRALLDPDAIAHWRLPVGMSIHLHAFEARVGGVFRVSLTYETAPGTGKSSAHTDTYSGRFLRLEPDRQVVETLSFETSDPSMQGEMTITTTLASIDGETEFVGTHEGLPPGVAPQDNILGWTEALDRLAALLDGGWRPASDTDP